MDFLGKLKQLLGGDRPQPQRGAMPMRQTAKPITRSQRDYPNRTNFGVPEDDMIDTPNGYVSAEEYDRTPVGQNLRVGQSIPNQSLRVGQFNMQPHSARYEDDYTATQAIQPVDYNNRQVSLNGGLMQGSQSGIRRRLR